MKWRAVVKYLLLGVAAYGLFLIWTFPAVRAVALLHQQLPQVPVRLSDVGGTVWSGRAAALQYQGQRLSRLNWQFRPLALFTGRLEFAVDFNGEGRSGRANIGVRYDGGVVVSAIDARLPLAELAPLLDIPVTLSGVAEIKLDELLYAANAVQRAEGEIQWRQIAVTEPVAQKMGDFSSRFTTEADGIKAQFRDLGGPMQLEGTLRLNLDGNYHFNARAVVRDPQQTLLRQALQAAGRMEGDGRITLDYSGRL